VQCLHNGFSTQLYIHRDINRQHVYDGVKRMSHKINCHVASDQHAAIIIFVARQVTELHEGVVVGDGKSDRLCIEHASCATPTADRPR